MNSPNVSKVKVMAAADVHGSYAEIVIPDGVNIVALVGDIVASKEPNWEDIRSCADKIAEICNGHPMVQFLLVLGNHDYAINDKRGLDEELESRHISNLYCFGKNARVVDVCGVRIGGFGWDAGRSEDRYLSKYEKEATAFDGVDVLLMHCPPRISGVHLHEENLGLAVVVEKVRPKLVVCGHAHGQAGEYCLDGVPVYCVAQCRRMFVLKTFGH